MKADTTVCFVVLLALLAFQEAQAHDNAHRGWRHNINRRFDVGYALRFDGNDFVSVPSLDLGTPISFEFLYRVDRTGGGVLFSFENGAAYLRLSLSTSNNNMGSFTLDVGQPNNQGQVTNPRSYTTGNFFPKNNKWQYVVIIYKHNGQVQFYLEESDVVNLKDGNGNIGTSLNWRTFTQNFIGKRSNGVNSFVGDLDEVRFWTKELSAEDDRDRSREIDPNQRSLQAWYNFNQGLGLIATDVSFKGKDGVLGGNVQANAPQWIIAGFTSTRTCKIFGDPNVKTFDRACLRLGTSRIGDFWLVDSPTNGYQIQARIATKAGSSANTALIGIAFQTVDHHVVFDLDFRTKTDSVLTVDGNVITTGTFTDASGTSILKEWVGNNKQTYEIEVPLTFSALITAFPRAKFAEITIRVISDQNANLVQGVCGDFDGNPNDDSTTTYWVVDTEDNLFLGSTDLGIPDLAYDCDIDTTPYITSDTRARAHQICENATIVKAYLKDSCLFDVCSTGDIGAAFGSAEISYFECLEDNENATASVCPKPCPNFCSFSGDCSNTDGSCTCYAGSFGADCSQTSSYSCYSASWPGKQHDLTPFGGLANAANHYKYSTTYGFSSDTGKELSDTTVAYIYEERPFGSAAKPSLIFINDKARDGSEGHAKVEFALSNGYATANIAPRDDPDDVYTTTTFRSNGKFTAEWDWWKCCTDGLVLGPLPSNFCVNMNITARDGINQVVVSSDNLFGTQDTYRVDSNSFKICGSQCNNTCGVYSDCSSCTGDSNCGWCVETETCELGSAAGPDRGRCNLWRYASDATTSRVVKTTIGFPVDPTNIEVFVPTGASAQANFFVFFPASQLMPIDIALLVDLTRDASFELSYIQSATAGSFANILQSYPQARLAIGSFSDRPENGFGSANRGDIAYTENLAFTDNLVHVQVALNTLTMKDGLDALNSQLEALQKAANSQTLQWRPKSMKIVVIVTKTLPHLPPNSFYSNSALDYPSVAAVGASLVANNVIPIFVVPHTIATTYQGYVSSWGVGYVNTITDGNIGSIYASVLDTVTSIAQSAKAFPIPGQSQNFASTPVYPATGYTGISPGTRVQFTANIINNGASTGALLVPGFGTVNFKFITSDLPYLVGVPPTLSITDGRAYDIITLETSGYYSPGNIKIITAPVGVAALFQVNSGNIKGSAIPSGGTVLDPQNRIWVQYTGTGSTSFTFKVVDGCLASSALYTVPITVTGTNQSPTAGSFSTSTNEGVTLPITLIGNDPDNNTPLRFWITSLPDSSLASLSGVTSVPTQLSGNSVSFVPAAFRFGTVTFNYRVVDALGAASTDATVTVTINPVNNAPTAVPATVSLPEDGSVLVNLAGTDAWGETLPQNLLRTIVATPAHGYLSLTARGTQISNLALGTTSAIYYNPASDYNGADSFTFTVTDSGNPVLTSTQATVGITVTAVNDAPTTTNQPFSGVEDTALTFSLTGNDVDNTNAQLRAVVCAWSGLGSLYDGSTTTNLIPIGSSNYVVQSVTRTLTYVPPANAFGDPLTSFTFRITDPAGASSGCATASITIAARNDQPIAIAPTTVYVNESSSTQITLRGYDVDITDHPLTFVICTGVNNIGTLGALGTPSIAQPDMSQVVVTYTAPSIGTTSTSFTFRVVDDRTPNPPTLPSPCVTVNIQVANVNDPPIAYSNPALGTEDTDLSITLSAFDQDSDPLTYYIQSLPAGSLYEADGSGAKTTIINSVPKSLLNNKVVYVPPTNANGSPLTSFTFAVKDAVLFSQPAVIGISINAVNDAPVASPFTVSTTMNTDVIVTGFLATDVDNTDNELTFYVSAGSITGTIYSCGTQVADPSCTSGSQITVETAVPSRRVLYRPPVGAYSPTNNTYESFSYRVKDTGAVNFFSSSVNVGVVIFFVNSPPTARADNDTITTDPGQCVQFQVEAQDPDGDNTHTYVLWSDFVGTLFQNNNGALGAEILDNGTEVSDPNGYVWYCAPSNPGGREGDPLTSLLFQAQDARGAQSNVVSVSVYIRARAVLPIANTTGRAIPEDTRLYIDLTGADSTRPTETFTCTITSVPAVGTLFLFGGAAITNALVLPQCRVEYLALPDENGANYARFNYTVTGVQSGLTSLPSTVIIDVSAVPDAPVANTPRPSTNEDTPVNFQFVISDPDIGRPSDSFTVTITQLPASGTLYQLSAGLVQGAPISAVGTVVSNPNLYVRYVPFPNTFGTDTLRYSVVDSYFLSAGFIPTLPIDVISINDPPVTVTTDHQGFNNILVTNVLLQVSDVDTLLSNVAIFFEVLPTKGTLYFNAAVPGNEVVVGVPYFSFSFRYAIAVPFASGSNYDNFRWRAYDGIDNSLSTTDTISIQYINTPPSFTSGFNFYTQENVAVPITLTASDPDVGDTVRIHFISPPTKGTLLRSDGVTPLDLQTLYSSPVLFYYKPNLNVNTYNSPDDSFQVEATDGQPNPFQPFVFVRVVAVNSRAVINVPTSPTVNLGGQANLLGISINDDASENVNAIVSLNISSVGATSIAFLDATGLTGYAPGIAISVTGTLTAINRAFSFGFIFNSDGSDPASVTISFDDLGNNDATGTPTLFGVISQDIIFDTATESAGAGAGFVGLAGLLSGAAFGGYKYMKKKKMIPEEADPWENDELFDMTLDNPLYSGTSPSSLEAVFDK